MASLNISWHKEERKEGKSVDFQIFEDSADASLPLRNIKIWKDAFGCPNAWCERG